MAPYVAPEKPARTVLTRHDSRETLEVKFVESTDVRLRRGQLVATEGTARLQRQLRTLADDGAVASVARLFTGTEAALAAASRAAATRSGQAQPDLNQWYRIAVRPGTDMAAFVDELNALDVVAIAYPSPEGAPPPATPDYSGRQGYRSPATASGIDADYARTVPGGTGANVQVIDIEYGWNRSHEDLSKLRAFDALVPNGTPSYSFADHGTAVAGQISGDANGLGVTGLAPDARMRITNVVSSRGWDAANAVAVAAAASQPGDVLLLEQQVQGCGGYVPVEWIASVYDAIRTTTARGIHVVEAAGNGGMNLDSSCFGTTFPRGQADSGAIIVGAGGAQGCSTARQKLGFSTYGSRVDLQGWGECVTTTGYGDLYEPTYNQMYTRSFSGTSSASPIVTGAVASLSSIAEQRGITLTPQQLRAHLAATGSAQVNPASGKIGPLPDLRAAVEQLGGGDGSPDFSLSLSPSSLSLAAGASATSTVRTTAVGEPQQVALSAAGAPAGVSVSFSPSTITAGETSTMTVAADASTSASTSSITVTGTGDRTHTAALSLTVTTGSGDCTGSTGNLAAGATAIEPDGTWYQSGAGTHTACLVGPDGTDFDLYLQRWTGSAWQTVAQSNASSPRESLSHDGSAGYYRYRVTAYRGGGSYTFGHTRP